MSIEIWISAAYSTVYRCGGWAYLRQGEGTVGGAVGGERHTTCERVALAGLAAALQGLPDAKASATVRLHTPSSELMGYARLLAALGGEAPAQGPADNLDLWAPIAAAARGRRMSLSRAPLDTHAPTAFTAAWAELGCDKAKTGGAFVSVLPKANLAKVKGLPVHNA